MGGVSACQTLRHTSDTGRIRVGHSTWCVVDKIRSQRPQTLLGHSQDMIRTRLDIFHGFFSLLFYIYIKLWANIHKAYCNPAIILKNP